MILLQQEWLLSFLIFLIGASVGSFVTLASHRLPRDEEIVVTPSHCPHCNARLTLPDLFPLLSWCWQRGRCRHCRASVSARYPLIELTLGLVFVFLFHKVGLSVPFVILAALATELLIMIVTDLEYTIIPDGVQVAAFFTGIAWCVVTDADWSTVLMMALLGLGLGLLLHIGYKKLRHKDGLGLADVKFFCMAGVWLSPDAFVVFLLLSGILGTLTGLLWRALGRGQIFPFGPALAVSLFINVLWPNLLPLAS